MLTDFLIFSAEYLIYGIVITVVLYFTFSFSPKERTRFILFGLLSGTIVFVLAQIAGRLYFDPRPFIIGHFIPPVSYVPDNGFPSDHTLVSATLASLVYPFRKKVGIALWLCALLVGISRIAVGVHHPVDILASIAIVLAGTTFSYWVLNRK